MLVSQFAPKVLTALRRNESTKLLQFEGLRPAVLFLTSSMIWTGSELRSCYSEEKKHCYSECNLHPNDLYSPFEILNI